MLLPVDNGRILDTRISNNGYIRTIYGRHTPTTTPTTTLKSFIVQADRAYGTEISPRLFVISFVILLYAISYNICI